MELTLSKVVEGLELSGLVEEDPSLDEVGHRLPELVRRVLRGRDCEDVVQFLKGTLLGFYTSEETQRRQRESLE